MNDICGSLNTGSGKPCKTITKNGELCYRHKEQEKNNDLGIEKPTVIPFESLEHPGNINYSNTTDISTNWREGKDNWGGTSFSTIKEKPSVRQKIGSWFSRRRKQSIANETL